MRSAMIDGRKIKARREKLGLSLADAARAAGGSTTRTWWHDVEAGRRTDITVSSLQKMAKALNCPLESLLAPS
jgi:transcriptional regulator with XRE-family HTH domain